MAQKLDSHILHTTWKVVNSHWICINENIPCTLAAYLWSYGFDISDSIEYCIAYSLNYRLKFRQFGGVINLYINRLN